LPPNGEQSTLSSVSNEFLMLGGQPFWSAIV